MSEELKALQASVAEIQKAITQTKDPEKIREVVKAALAESVTFSKAEAEKARQSQFAIDHANAGEIQSLIHKSVDPRNAADSEVVAFQDWNDACLILNAVNVSKRARGEEAPRLQETALYKSGVARFGKIAKALDTSTSSQGTEFVPTEFSNQLEAFVRLERKVAKAMRNIAMPSNPFVLPIGSSGLTAYKLPESTTDDASKMTAGQPGTGKCTLTAVKFGVRVVFSEEINEDSVVAIMPFVREECANAINDAEEECIISGDTTATHMDADVTSSADRRKLWKGIRKLGLAMTSKLDSAGAALTHANLQKVRGTMGKYGVNPKNLILVCGPIAYAALSALDQVTTLEKYGSDATIKAGELAKWSGIPVIVSELYREDQNVSGVYDLTTHTRLSLSIVNHAEFALGTRRGITVKVFENVETDQTVLAVTARKDFQPIHGTSQTSIGTLYNVPNT